MTLEEAQKLALIAAEVDGGCRFCVGSVVRKLNESFPDFIWVHNSEDDVVTVRPREGGEK